MKKISLYILLTGILFTLFPGICSAQLRRGMSSELEDAFLQKPKLAKIQDTKENIPASPKEEIPKNSGNEKLPIKDPVGDRVTRKSGLAENTMKSKGTKNVSINLNGVPLNDALLSLARQAGVSITIDRGIDVAKVRVTAYYEGDSFEDAISAIISGLDYAYRKIADGSYAVTPYEEAVFEVHDIRIKQREPISFANAPVAAGGSSGSPAIQPGTNLPSPTSGSGFLAEKSEESQMAHIVESIKKMLSPKGVVTPMTSGFLYVRDVPSRIKMVKEMLDTDVKKRNTITMKITLLRIDYKDQYETGINWAAFLDTAKGPLFGMDVNVMQGLENAKSNIATIRVADTNFAGVLKMLGTYGDVNVINSWESKAVSGAILPFEMSQTLWYTTGTTLQVINTQTVNTVSVAPVDIGLKMTVNPLKLEKGYLVNTSIDLSNFLGFQYIEKMELPQIERNYVSIPIKMSIGETVAISGFKMKAIDKKRIGIPILSQLPVLGLLFGYTSSKDSTSELTILINFIDEKGGQV
ncbi:MAG: type II secretion system protein GspD [Syntrophorhabdaceae bacterium]